MLGSVVLLYVYTVVKSLYIHSVHFMLTNESPGKITFMNCVDQSQLRFLSVPLQHHLNCCMLAMALLPRRMDSGKKSFTHDIERKFPFSSKALHNLAQAMLGSALA